MAAAPSNLKELYTADLRDLCSANDQMQKVVQAFSDKATDPKLKQLFEKSVTGISQHTQAHDTRLALWASCFWQTMGTVALWVKCRVRSVSQVACGTERVVVLSSRIGETSWPRWRRGELVLGLMALAALAG